MKRILFLVLLFVVATAVKAQYPVTQFLGSDSAMVKSRGGLQGRFAPIPFTDTTSANLSRISQYPGALIYTSGVDKYWYRNATSTGWIEFTSSGGSTVNIYNSDGQLTGNRSLNGLGYKLTFDELLGFELNSTDSLIRLNYTRSGKSSVIDIGDTIKINPNLGNLLIDTLNTTQDTATYKPIVVDPITGRVMQSSYWYGSGSGGSTDTTSLSNRINSKADTLTVWKLGGNYNINPLVDYLGTNDSAELHLRVNGQIAGMLTMSDKYSTSFGLNSFASLTTGLYNTAIGSRSMYKTQDGNFNTSIGAYSLHENISSSLNVAIGPYSLYKNTDGNSNISIGYQSLYENLGGGNSIAIGHTTLKNNTTGTNIAFGTQSLFSNTTGSSNISIGNTALVLNQTSSDNIAIGFSSLYNHKTNYGNIGIGNYSLYSDTSGLYNTSIGHYSMYTNKNGSQNTSIGGSSLRLNTTGEKNTSVGAGAMENNTTGGYNVGIGQDALLANTTGIRNIGIGWNGFANNFTGYQNVGIGYGSGKSITYGVNNTLIGAFSGWVTGQLDTVTNSIAIGAYAINTKDSQTVIGTTATNEIVLYGSPIIPNVSSGGVAADSVLVIASDGSVKKRNTADFGGGGGSGTVTSVGTGYGLSGGTITTTGTLAIDTALISTRLWRQKGVDSVQGNVTSGLALKLNLSDTASMFTPYARIEAAATGSIVKWNSDRALGTSSILYDNGTNAGATGTFLAPAMKSATSTHYYSFRVDGNLGMGEVFSDGSYIQRMIIAGYHYIQSVNTPVNGLFIGTYPGQSYINLKNDGRICYDTLNPSAQWHTFRKSGRFTDTLFAKTLENLDDSSDVVATTAWVKAQLYGAGGGASDGYVDGATFSTSTNTLTLTQTGAADVTVRIPPSYLQNPIDQDSLIKEVNDSVGRIKAVKVVSDHPEILVTTTRNDSINTHTLSKIYISEPIATFSAGAGFVADTALFTDSTLYGSFFTDQDSFYITRVIVVMKGQAGDSLGIQIVHNDSINVTGTVIDGGTLAVNSLTTGNAFSISTNQGIPPNSWVWVKSPTVIAGKRPEYLSITLVGYKKWIAP